MRVLICGPRDLPADSGAVRAMQALVAKLPMGSVVIQGGAKGADHLAAWAGHANAKQVLTFPADWRRYGRGAGPIRNQQMLDDGLPDEIWAFLDRPLEHTKGTRNMVWKAQAAGFVVRIFEVTDSEPNWPMPPPIAEKEGK